MSETITDDDADAPLPRDDFAASESLSSPEAAEAEPSEIFDEAKLLTIPVSPARFASGTYDHQRNRDIGEGDIHASYSADTIAMSGKIRRAFRWHAQLMVTTSLSGLGGIEQAEAYQLIPLKVFSGTPTTYADRIETADNADAARNDPNGFYHGITVRQSSETFVLSGPPVLFVAEEGPARPDGALGADPEQLSLF